MVRRVEGLLLEETPEDPSEVQSFHFPDFDRDAERDSATEKPSESHGRSRLRVEYGKTKVLRSETDAWRSGVTITLPQLHSEPVTVLLDDEPIARGELVEMDGKLGVRIVELLAGSDADSGLQRSA